MRVYHLLIIVLLITYGCRKDQLKIIEDTHYQYFSLEVGSSWTYQMDNILFYGDEGLKPDTFSYQVKNKIDAKEESLGSTTYVLSREYQDTSRKWNYLRSFRVIVDSTSVHRIIEDKREVILNFPFSMAIEWDSNVFNTDDESECYFLEVHQSKTINSQFYDSTSTVYREAEDFFISQKFEKEIYAKNVGLVYSEIVNLERLEFENMNKHFGSKFTQTLVSYEK